MTTTADIPTRTGPRYPRAVLAIILVAYFMIILDNSIVFTGLPLIQQELGFTTTGLSWVTNAYVLAFGGLLLLGARMGDILGRRRTFFLGLAVFTVASLGITIAPTAEVLLIARAVQGAGAAILAPSTLALLTASFPPGPERTRAIAAYGSVAGIGASIGLVVGGILADTVSWRAGFFLNVPLGILMAIAALRVIDANRGIPGRFDIAGAITSTLGMTALVFGIVHAAETSWTDPLTLTALPTGLLLLTLFVIIESRAVQPIMPLRLLRSRERMGANVARMLFIGAMLGFFFFTTQYLQLVLGFSPLEAGLAFLPMTVVNFIVAVLVPRLTALVGNRVLVAAGIGVTGLGMFWLSRVGVDSDYLTAVALPMAVIGIGQGLALAPLTASGVAGVAEADAGAASGLLNTFHQLGGSLGLGIMVVLAASAAGTGGLHDVGVVASPAQTAASAAAALTGGSVLLALSLAVAIAFVVVAPRRRPAA